MVSPVGSVCVEPNGSIDTDDQNLVNTFLGQHTNAPDRKTKKQK